MFTEEYYARLKEQDEILLTQQNQIEELKQQLYTSNAYLAQQQQQQQQQATSQPSMSQSYGIYFKILKSLNICFISHFIRISLLL